MPQGSTSLKCLSLWLVRVYGVGGGCGCDHPCEHSISSPCVYGTLLQSAFSRLEGVTGAGRDVSTLLRELVLEAVSTQLDAVLDEECGYGEARLWLGSGHRFARVRIMCGSKSKVCLVVW